MVILEFYPQLYSVGSYLGQPIALSAQESALVLQVYRGAQFQHNCSQAPSYLPHCYTIVYVYMPIASSSYFSVRGGQPIWASLGITGESDSLSNSAATLTASQYQTQESLYQALPHFQWLGEYSLQCLSVAYAYHSKKIISNQYICGTDDTQFNTLTIMVDYVIKAKLLKSLEPIAYLHLSTS